MSAPGCLLQGGGGACSGGSAPGGMPAGGKPAPGGGRHGDPTKADSYCCRRYASYWNAFLFFMSMLNNNGTIFTIFLLYIIYK